MVKRQVFLDCRKLTERESAHEYLGEILEFPAYYGHNLDALYDCLLEVQDCDIVLQYEQEACLEGTYGERILKVLEEAAFENPGLNYIVDFHSLSQG